jgi:hypothetical protein
MQVWSIIPAQLRSQNGPGGRLCCCTLSGNQRVKIIYAVASRLRHHTRRCDDECLFVRNNFQNLRPTYMRGDSFAAIFSVPQHVPSPHAACAPDLVGTDHSGCGDVRRESDGMITDLKARSGAFCFAHQGGMFIY